jgi:hypothetical protein
MLPYGTPKRHFSVHFAFRIPTKSTLGALLVPLFGQFQYGILGSSRLWRGSFYHFVLAPPAEGKCF